MKNKIFWIIFILFTNPGGIQQALGIYEFGIGGANLNDYLFVIMLGLSLLTPKAKGVLSPDYQKTGMYLLVFMVYYFMVFAYFTPLLKETASQNIIFNLIKSRWVIYSISLYFIVYKFFIRSYLIFFKFLVWSSIIVFLIFFFSVITGIEILPYTVASRGFIDIDRNLLLSYGLMPMLVPIGVVLVIFNVNIKYRKVLLIAAVMMFLAWLISLTRRHIFGAFIYVFLATLLYNYIQGKKLISISPIIRIVMVSVFIVVVVYFTFPRYIDAGIKTFETTIYVIQHGETQDGRQDQRLGFDRTFIVDKFYDSPIVGTGFDNNWRTSDGDKAGYEASDYPLLAAFAMHGILGIFIFLPVYLLLIKSLRNDIRVLRKLNVRKNSFEYFMLVVFIIIFVYILLQYMNWFGFVSNPGRYSFIVFLAMYYASRKLFYDSLKLENAR